MANWSPNSILITTRGREILSRVVSGVGSINIARVVTGSGRVTESLLYSQTAITNIKQEMELKKVTPTQKGSVIDLQVSNIGLAQSYEVNQIGVYVTHPDYSGEQLYLIAQCSSGSADLIPLPDQTPLTMFYSIYLSHEGVSDITITPQLSGYATLEDLEQVKDEVMGTSKLNTATGTTNIVLSESALIDKVPITFIAIANNDSQPTTVNGVPLYKYNTTITPRVLSGKSLTVCYIAEKNCYYTLDTVGGDADTVNGKTVGTNVPVGAVFTDTVFIHPDKHAPSIIAQDSDNRFVTDAEKVAWNNKAPGNHSHDYSPSNHNHDSRYYTESEVDTLLGGKAPSSHAHDDRYYTESEMNTLLGGKAASSHSHAASQVTAGALPVGVLATNSTDYTTSRVRNARFGTTVPTSLANGEIYFMYE